MKTATDVRRIFEFSWPSPDLLMPASEQYLREQRLAGAPSVEIKVSDHETVIISATRYLPTDVVLSAVEVHGVVEVTCTRAGDQPIVMRGFPDWVSFTVHRRRFE